MANNEAEQRENLLRRQISNWASGNANGPNAAPLGDLSSRNLQLQHVLAQQNMQQNQQPGGPMQQWRMGLNQQPQRFPQTMTGALPNSPMVYNAQTRPTNAPFESDAAAAIAAARSRLSQNQQQNQRADAPLFSGRNDTNAAPNAPNAAAAAAAVLARVRQQQQQQQQQGIPNSQLQNPQPQNPQQQLMQTNPLTDDRWKALNNRPQLAAPLHLPAMPLHQTVRPPMMGPQMPTPFPNQVLPQMMRPPFSSSPPAPSRPSILNDQPRLAAFMAEYNNRMAPGMRPPMMPTEFGMPRPMMAPRHTPLIPLPAARPAVPIYPAVNGPAKPMIPNMQPPSSLPANLTMPPAMYPTQRPVLPNFNVPVSPQGTLPPTSVPNALLNMPTKPQIGMGWPDAMPHVHPSLVRSNSAPPIPPQPFFNPIVHYSHIANMPQMTGMNMPMMTYPLAEGMYFPDHAAFHDGGVSDTLSRTSPKLEIKEECGATSTEVIEEDYKQKQRPMSADSMVRRCGSAAHGDVEAEGHSHRNPQSASPSTPTPGPLWNNVSQSIRSRRHDENSDDDTRLQEEDQATSDALDGINLESSQPVYTVEQPSVEECTVEELTERKPSVESPSRAVVISDFNRYGALVEDTVLSVSDDGQESASSKHRKVAIQRNPARRRVRPSPSNNVLGSMTFGNSSPAVSSHPEIHSTEPTIGARSKDSEVAKISPDKQVDGDLKKSRLPFNVPSFFPPFPSATFSVVLSLQYAKIIIVLGLVLPLSELLSPYIRPYSYRAFYLYLYMGSILFMIYINISAAWRRRVRLSIERRKGDGDVGSGGGGGGGSGGGSGSGRTCASVRLSRFPRLRFKKDQSESEDVRYGSVYLRVGVNAFGIGSMVYCGLEIAREIEQWTLPSASSHLHEFGDETDRPVRLLLPACRAILTIFQMHFILFNEKASEIRRQRTPARVGLAHMIATNVCEWLGVVVQETRHEITQLNALNATTHSAHPAAPQVVTSNSSVHPHDMTVSDASEGIVGPLLHSVSPLLSPCTIEYSLICAFLLFEMWKEVGQAEDDSNLVESLSVSSASGGNANGDSPVVGALATVGATGAAVGSSSLSYSGGGVRSRGAHHLSADLTHSQRGAFGGVLLLVLTFLGVALLSAQRSLSVADQNKSTLTWLPFDAVLEAILSSAVILGVVGVALSTRKLAFDNVPAYPLPLDLFLLVIAQTSAYVYSLFVIIGCYVLLRNAEEPSAVHYHAAIIMAVEALSTFRAYAQTHVIVRAWHRRPADAKQAKEKPGRQAVTFLLFANLCLWAASTFGSARAQRLPHHMRLFGTWPWTAIAHACLPLTIFLHLHSSICLFELWKNCYKFRPD